MTPEIDDSHFSLKNAHEQWRHRIRNHIAAKREMEPTTPSMLSLDIAKVGVEAVVEELLEDPRTKAEVPPSWINRKIITKAVESLIYEPEITPESKRGHAAQGNPRTA